MPEEKNNSTTFLIVILVIVIIITIGLAGLYFFTGPNGTPRFLKSSKVQKTVQPAANKNVQIGSSNLQLTTSVYEGFIQELSQKEKTIGDVTYNYVIGLVDKKDNSVPVWLTDDEYNTLSVYKYVQANQVQGTLSDIKGGAFLKITRSMPVNGTIEDSRVLIEIIY